MRKIFSVACIIIIASFNIFAGTVSGPSSSMGESLEGSAYIDIQLGIDPSQMYFYTFGFSNELDIDALTKKYSQDTPKAAASTLSLKFEPTSSTAYNEIPLYFWYKVRTNEKFTFNIETLGALVDLNEKADPLDWIISFERVDISGSSANNTSKASISSKSGDMLTTLIVEPNEEGETYSAFKVDIVTDVIPFLPEKAQFSGTLKMSIAAN